MRRTLAIHSDDGSICRWEFEFSENGELCLPVLDAAQRWPWTRLSFCQCTCCSLSPEDHSSCPVAEILARYALDLADRDSCEAVRVVVIEDDDCRLIFDRIPLHDVVGELVRLAVFQGNCPVGGIFRPIMWRMRPFPKREHVLEALALFHVIHSRDSDDSLAVDAGGGVHGVENLHGMFGWLSRRFSTAGAGDVYQNAVVIMDSLSTLYSLVAPELIDRARNEYGLTGETENVLAAEN